MESKSYSIPWLAVVAALLTLVLFAGSNWAARPRPQDANASTGPSAAHPDISGFWEPRADGRGRGAGPQMTPAAAARAQARREAMNSGADSGVTQVGRWCRALAFPFYLTSSPPWDIIQGPNEIIVLAERQEGSRHIYMDGRGHPDAAHLQITADGDSIGHWEGDTLVVDTIGLKSGVDTTGTFRGSNQHLVERYQLLDANRLSVSYTWEDPEVYAQPYTTVKVFHRSDSSIYALEDWCDASDELQYKSDAAPAVSTAKPAAKPAH